MNIVSTNVRNTIPTNVTTTILTNVRNTMPTNVTSTVSTNFYEKSNR